MATTYHQVKTIRGYAALARFIAECAEDAIGYIPKQVAIPSPYRYSPVHEVLAHDVHGRVFYVETAHRVYTVFRLNDGEPVVPAEVAERIYLQA